MPALLREIPEVKTSPQCSRFPGTAQVVKSVNTGSEKIYFVKGTVIFASPRIQYVQPRAKYVGFWKGGIVHLIGESYLFVCDRCEVSVCAWQLPKIEDVLRAWHEKRTPNKGELYEEAVGRPHCPYCFGFLSEIKVGDKVLIHYRYKHSRADRDGKIIEPGWAMWFAERKEW